MDLTEKPRDTTRSHNPALFHHKWSNIHRVLFGKIWNSKPEKRSTGKTLLNCEQQAHFIWCWFTHMLVQKCWACANPWIAETQCKPLFRLLNCCSTQIFDWLSLRFEFDEAATEKKPPDSSHCTCYTLLFFEIGTTLQRVTGRHKLINSAGYVGHRRSVYVLCTSLRFSACGGISAAG